MRTVYRRWILSPLVAGIGSTIDIAGIGTYERMRQAQGAHLARKSPQTHRTICRARMDPAWLYWESLWVAVSGDLHKAMADQQASGPGKANELTGRN